MGSDGDQIEFTEFREFIREQENSKPTKLGLYAFLASSGDQIVGLEISCLKGMV